MKLLIIRHGEPDYSIDSLTPKGWREAELLADRLEKLNIDDYYSSPLGRAQDTAKEILRRTGKQLEILPWLCEFRGRMIDPINGRQRYAWDLLPEYWTQQPELYEPRHWTENAAYATGNSAEIYAETQKGLDELLGRYGYTHEGALYHADMNSNATIALFCHHGIAMTVFSCLTGMPLVPMLHSFIMLPSSVTTLITEERTKGNIIFRCVGLGELSHLYAGGEPASEMGRFRESFEAEGRGVD